MTMVRVKTADLVGAQLDWAVAKAEGKEAKVNVLTPDIATCCVKNGPGWATFHPSRTWDRGGPIIERERISSGHAEDEWHAGVSTHGGTDAVFGHGPTPLIAAMRAFVASNLGDEVEVPELQP